MHCQEYPEQLQQYLCICDSFTNLIGPTSGCLIGSLAIAKIEWSNWIKFMWKFLGVLMIGAIITVLISVGIGF